VRPLLLAVLLAGAAEGAESARALLARAGEALKAGRLAEATALYERAEPAARTPDGRAAAAHGAGLALFRQRHYADAAGRLERAVAAAPRRASAWSLLGDCRLKLYESGASGTVALDGAIAAYRQAGALDPAAGDGDRRLAEADLARELAWDAAAAARAAAPPRSPAAEGTFAAYRAAGEQAEREGDPALALADYARAEAVAASPRAKAAAANLQGLVALARRAPRDARAAFQRAADLDPASKYAWNNLGVALLRVYDSGEGGRELLDAAAAAFARVAELDPAYKAENRAWVARLQAELGAPVPPAGSATLADPSAASATAPPR